VTLQAKRDINLQTDLNLTYEELARSSTRKPATTSTWARFNITGKRHKRCPDSQRCRVPHPTGYGSITSV